MGWAASSGSSDRAAKNGAVGAEGAGNRGTHRQSERRAMDLGRVGIWSGQFRSKDTGAARDAARELEGLGFGALWIPGGAGGDIFGDVTRVLSATTTLPVVTGILNVWMHDANDVASEHARIGAAYPERF